MGDVNHWPAVYKLAACRRPPCPLRVTNAEGSSVGDRDRGWFAETSANGAPGPAFPRLAGPAALASMAARPNASVTVPTCPPRGLAPQGVGTDPKQSGSFVAPEGRQLEILTQMRHVLR